MEDGAPPSRLDDPDEDGRESDGRVQRPPCAQRAGTTALDPGERERRGQDGGEQRNGLRAGQEREDTERDDDRLATQRGRSSAATSASASHANSG